MIALCEDLSEIDEVKALVDIAQEERDKDQQGHGEQGNTENDLHGPVDVAALEEETSSDDDDRFFIAAQRCVLLFELGQSTLLSSRHGNMTRILAKARLDQEEFLWVRVSLGSSAFGFRSESRRVALRSLLAADVHCACHESTRVEGRWNRSPATHVSQGFDRWHRVSRAYRVDGQKEEADDAQGEDGERDRIFQS